MKRLVDYDSTDSDSSSASLEEISEQEKIDHDVKATIYFLLNQVSKIDQELKKKPPYWLDRKGYRDMALAPRSNDLSSSDTSDSESSSSAEGLTTTEDDALSDDSDCVYSKIVAASRRLKNRLVRPGKMPKTKGEISLNDLPPIENLRISVPESVQFVKFGTVSSIVDTLVVVLSDPNVPALDEDSLLFTEDRQSLGKVFETFGPVSRPFYSIRFNNVAEIAAEILVPGVAVYYVPDRAEFTHTVFTDVLRQIKGTDASWEDNNEPPPDVVEFSDDEEERRWKARRRGKTGQEVVAENGAVENAPAPKRRMKVRRRGQIQRPCVSSRSSSFYSPQVSNAHSFVLPPSSHYPAVPPTFRPPGNPWMGTSRASDPFPFNPNVPPPSSSNWMWMSEDAFRLPPPPLPQGFGRRKLVFPAPPPPPQPQQVPRLPVPMATLTDHRFVQRNA